MVPFVVNICLDFYGFAAIASSRFVKLGGCRGTLTSGRFLRTLNFSATLAVIAAIIVGIITFTVTCVLAGTVGKSGVFHSIFFVPGLVNNVVLNCV